MKFYLIFIYLYAGYLIRNIYAQSQTVINQNVDAIETLFLEREAYFTNSEENRIKIFFKRAHIFQESGRYNLAVEELKRIPQYNLNDSLNEIWLYKIAFNLYMTQNFGEADSYLSQLFLNNDTVVLNKYAWLKILCLNEMGKWSEAKWVMEQTPVLKRNSLLTDAYSEKNYPKLKSPRTAQILNLVFPGLGFFYSGYVFEGIVSSSLLLGSLVLTGGAIYYGYYITALLGGVQLSQMFYLGGARRSEFLANKHNYFVSRKYNQKLKMLILGN